MCAHVTCLHALCGNKLPPFCVPAGCSHWLGAGGAGACACVRSPGPHWGQGLSSYHRKCGSPTMALTFPWVIGFPRVVFTFPVG